MPRPLRVPFALALLGSLLAGPALGATFKCEVAGRVAYQDRPCDTDIAARGRESRLDAHAPPARAAVPGPAPSQAVAGRVVPAKAGVPPGTDPEAFARRAFDRLKSGDLDAWSEGLCPERRVALQQAPARDEFRRTSLRIASKGATIASVKRIEGNGVTLNASELVSGRPRSASTRYSSFVVGIGDDLGRACVLGVSYY